jgi:MEMO1 family protein
MFHRSMALAGSWYPPTAEECLEQIRSWERSAPEAPTATAGIRCCVAPHAGWVYSGRLAARAIRAACGAQPASIQLVILLGGHLRRDDPVVAMAPGEWETPFGAFSIHTGFDAHLAKLPNIERDTANSHDSDNSIEVLLPFARRLFPDAALLPLRVPPSEVALELGTRLAEYLSDAGIPAVAIASTDLTHYGPSYGFEPRGRGSVSERWVRDENDPLFLRAMESGSGSRILDTARRQRNACCPGAVAAVNEIVRHQPGGPAFRMLEYATSLDAARSLETVGRKLDFVGYAAGVYA